MSKENLFLGQSGEALALDFLKDKGYKILSKNYKSKLGEIDIIARDKDIICFVEVKTRSSDKFGLPCEAIINSKQRQICRAALMFLQEKKLFGQKARFDVISILYSQDNQKIDLIKNAFELNERYSY